MSVNKRKRGTMKLDVVDSTEEISIPKVVVVKPKISFQAWFIKQTKLGKLRFYQDDAVLVFFKKNGLTETEDPDRYQECFKKF